MNDIVIRSASPEDAQRLLEIYAYYVTDTAVSFETAVPTVTEFGSRISRTLQHYPYYVAEAGGRIIGYAYAGPFVGREAYRFSCEMTVYLDKDERGHGCGALLYDALEKDLKQRGVLNLYACIAHPEHEDEFLTCASERFHARMGFHKVGVFTKCGYKFGRWYHMIWMEKLIGEHR